MFAIASVRNHDFSGSGSEDTLISFHQKSRRGCLQGWWNHQLPGGVTDLDSTISLLYCPPYFNHVGNKTFVAIPSVSSKEINIVV